MSDSISSGLGLPNSQTLYCKVWSYLVSHSLLLLRVYKSEFVTDDAYYLLFEGVVYFEGPMTWQGADFHFEMSDECLNLLHKIGGYESIQTDYLLQRIHLFKFETPELEIRILANQVERGNNIPEAFFWLMRQQ